MFQPNLYPIKPPDQPKGDIQRYHFIPRDLPFNKTPTGLADVSMNK